MAEILHTGLFGVDAFAFTCFARNVIANSWHEDFIVSKEDKSKKLSITFEKGFPCESWKYLDTSLSGLKYIPIVMFSIVPLITFDNEVVLADRTISAFTKERRQLIQTSLRYFRKGLVLMLEERGFREDEELALCNFSMQDEFSLNGGRRLTLMDIKSFGEDFSKKEEDPFKIEQRKLAVKELTEVCKEFKSLFLDYKVDWCALLKADNYEEEFKRQYEGATQYLEIGAVKKTIEVLKLVDWIDVGYFLSNFSYFEEL